MSTAPARRKTMAGGHSGPRHVAIIMDGNGRWAKRRFLPRIMGHRRGVEAVRRVVEAAPDLGIEVLTLYAFSSETWKRPADAVSDLDRQSVVSGKGVSVRVDLGGCRIS